MAYLVTKTFLEGALCGLTIDDPSPVSFEVGKVYSGGMTGPRYRVVACTDAAAPLVVYVEDDEPFTTTLGAFLAANDGLSDDERASVRRAAQPRSCEIIIGGGGAAPAWCLHRATEGL